MTKRAFPTYTFCKLKRYLCRHIIKPRSVKLCDFLNRLQELNAYLGELPPDTLGQETVPLHTDKVMDTTCHSILTTWKNKIIEEALNSVESTAKEIACFF